MVKMFKSIIENTTFKKYFSFEKLSFIFMKSVNIKNNNCNYVYNYTRLAEIYKN